MTSQTSCGTLQDIATATNRVAQIVVAMPPPPPGTDSMIPELMQAVADLQLAVRATIARSAALRDSARGLSESTSRLQSVLGRYRLGPVGETASAAARLP